MTNINLLTTFHILCFQYHQPHYEKIEIRDNDNCITYFKGRLMKTVLGIFLTLLTAIAIKSELSSTNLLFVGFLIAGGSVTKYSGHSLYRVRGGII
jgi:hypothetical protein